MTKKKSTDFVSEWSNLIRNMKRTVEYYYSKEDIDRKQPYKVTGVRTHYKTGEALVTFHPLRIDECVDYVLEKEEFLSLFDQVVEEI